MQGNVGGPHITHCLLLFARSAVVLMSLLFINRRAFSIFFMKFLLVDKYLGLSSQHELRLWRWWWRVRYIRNTNLWIDYRTFSPAGWKDCYILKHTWHLVSRRETYSPLLHLLLGGNSAVTYNTSIFFTVRGKEGGKGEKRKTKRERWKGKGRWPWGKSQTMLVELSWVSLFKIVSPSEFIQNHTFNRYFWVVIIHGTWFICMDTHTTESCMSPNQQYSHHVNALASGSWTLKSFGPMCCSTTYPPNGKAIW